MVRVRAVRRVRCLQGLMLQCEQRCCCCLDCSTPCRRCRRESANQNARHRQRVRRLDQRSGPRRSVTVSRDPRIFRKICRKMLRNSPAIRAPARSTRCYGLVRMRVPRLPRCKSIRGRYPEARTRNQHQERIHGDQRRGRGTVAKSISRNNPSRFCVGVRWRCCQQSSSEGIDHEAR